MTSLVDSSAYVKNFVPFKNDIMHIQWYLVGPILWALRANSSFSFRSSHRCKEYYSTSVSFTLCHYYVPKNNITKATVYLLSWGHKLLQRTLIHISVGHRHALKNHRIIQIESRGGATLRVQYDLWKHFFTSKKDFQGTEYDTYGHLALESWTSTKQSTTFCILQYLIILKKSFLFSSMTWNAATFSRKRPSTSTSSSTS